MGRQLADAIAKHQWIGIDTGVFIYHLELHPIYSPLTTTALNMV
ncbi:MAG: hypothetical protein O7E52_23925 [Candidatus Poribacteria bacterium]|nr:hypothetical protein [Candidatus Poribacteria bacterium]